MKHTAQCIAEDPAVLRGKAIGLEGDHQRRPLRNPVDFYGTGVVGRSLIGVSIDRSQDGGELRPAEGGGDGGQFELETVAG